VQSVGFEAKCGETEKPRKGFACCTKRLELSFENTLKPLNCLKQGYNLMNFFFFQEILLVLMWMMGRRVRAGQRTGRGGGREPGQGKATMKHLQKYK